MILPFPVSSHSTLLHKLPTDPKQDLRPNLHLASFHRGEIVLADANAFGELHLRHIKAAHLPDAATYRHPVDRDVFAASILPLTAYIYIVIKYRYNV